MKSCSIFSAPTRIRCSAHCASTLITETRGSFPNASTSVIWSTVTLPPRVQKIPFTRTREDPTARVIDVAEIYLMNLDGTDAPRLTHIPANGLPALSQDGGKSCSTATERALQATRLPRRFCS